jgi:hypothetical protein
MRDIVINLLLFAVALWFLYTGYQGNKKAKPLSWSDFTSGKGFDDLFLAGRLVTGAGIILILVLKLLLNDS